ncbi:hypothetical protein FIBSPDRAFT_871916, partial [Athelia psychrophila]
MAHKWWAVKGTAFHEIMVLRPEWECGGLADARAGWRVRARCWRVRGCEGGGMARLQADVFMCTRAGWASGMRCEKAPIHNPQTKRLLQTC